jgi:hypothetical protein
METITAPTWWSSRPGGNLAAEAEKILFSGPSGLTILGAAH